MPRHPSIHFRLTPRAIAALTSLAALIIGVVMLVYALTYTDELWPWLGLSAMVLIAGIGARYAKRR